MIKPTIHLNGTSAKSLIEDLLDARAAVEAAIEAMSKASPNGRDYYPQGPDVVYKAIEEHRERVAKLQSVSEDLMTLAMHCDNPLGESK